MGRVLFGAAALAALGGFLGSLPSYRGVFITPASGPRLDVAEPLRAASTMIGAGAGAVVGAVAGAVSAQPGARPVPRGVWFLLLAVALVALALTVFWLFHGSPPRTPVQEAVPG
jgi:hypothetical protein